MTLILPNKRMGIVLTTGSSQLPGRFTRVEGPVPQQNHNVNCSSSLVEPLPYLLSRMSTRQGRLQASALNMSGHNSVTGSI